MPNFVSPHILYTLTEAKPNFDEKGAADINLVQKWYRENLKRVIKKKKKTNIFIKRVSAFCNVYKKTVLLIVANVFVVN
jgi:hypothetical protein